MPEDDLNVRPLTAKQKRAAFFLMANILQTAHRLIESCIEGRPLDANRLENYYGAWTDLMDSTGDKGSLIEAVAESLGDRF